MSDQEFPLRLASPAELREMVQTLTRERDEARRLHMGQAGRAAGWRARARYAREALERLIELVADDPEAKDTTTPLCVAVTVARAEVTAIEEAERRDADRSTPPLELTVREAARQRVPLDGADAQALEGALALTERERDEARELWRREETRMREAEWALDAAGVSATAPMPLGVAGCQTFSVAERIGTLAAQRDEARAEVEELRTRTAAQLEIETRARDAARAEAERLRYRLQTVVDEQVSPHETLPAEELITLLERSLAEGRHERERLRGALERAERRLTELADVDTFDAEVPWLENEKPEDRARAGAEDARAALAGEGE